MIDTIKGFNGNYRFLSNFWPSEIEFEGMKFPTVEHAYQAAKTTDHELRKLVLTKKTGAGAKSIGRNLALRDDWEDIKLFIMKTLVRKKFYDPVLRAALLATHTAELVEENYWHDQFWGSCSCVKHAKRKGDNHLGKILMEQRAEIHQERKLAVMY